MLFPERLRDRLQQPLIFFRGQGHRGGSSTRMGVIFGTRRSQPDSTQKRRKYFSRACTWARVMVHGYSSGQEVEYEMSRSRVIIRAAKTPQCLQNFRKRSSSRLYFPITVWPAPWFFLSALGSLQEIRVPAAHSIRPPGDPWLPRHLSMTGCPPSSGIASRERRCLRQLHRLEFIPRVFAADRMTDKDYNQRRANARNGSTKLAQENVRHKNTRR